MSDETDETPETPAPAAKPKGALTRPGGIQQDSDRPARPGFRNPATPRSLARQKSKKK